MIKRALALLALSACTPQQIDLWQQWHAEDPAAALEFIEDGCAGTCWTDQTADPDDVPDLGVYEPWISLAECESGSNPPDWSIDTGNGYYGGLQFAWGSWESVGGVGNPAHATPGEQIYRGELLLEQQGWNAWPTCSRIIGLL